VLHPFQHSQLSFPAPDQQANSTTDLTVGASGCASPNLNASE
jgi:hypothetical protein